MRRRQNEVFLGINQGFFLLSIRSPEDKYRPIPPNTQIADHPVREGLPTEVLVGSCQTRLNR